VDAKYFKLPFQIGCAVAHIVQECEVI
jgi:hypothetical protein